MRPWFPTMRSSTAPTVSTPSTVNQDNKAELRKIKVSHVDRRTFGGR